MATSLRPVETQNQWWGNRVRTLRKAARLSQSELAALTGIDGVSDDTLSRIERGQRAPSLALGLALARIFGVPAEVLFSTPPEENGAIAA